MALFSLNSNSADSQSTNRQEGHVKGSERQVVILAWLFAGIWNFFSLFTFLLSYEKKEGPIWLFLIFSIIGIALLLWAIHETLRLKKYGDPALDIDFVPVPIGGRFQARIGLQTPLGHVPEFKLTFSCVNRITSGTGRNRSTRENILYQDTQTITILPSGIIPIAFDVPADGLETDKHDSNNLILWRLRATADFPGIPFVEQYEVPVRQLDSLPPEQAALVAKSMAAHQADVLHYQRPADSRIYVRSTPEGKTEFLFSAGRSMAPVFFLLIFLAFGAIFWTLIHHFIFHVFILLGGLLTACMLLKALFGTTTVTIGSGMMDIRHSIFGFNLGTTTIPASDALKFKIKIGSKGTSTPSSSMKVYYDIVTVCQNREVTAGSAVEDKMEAESLAAQMMQCLKGS